MRDAPATGCGPIRDPQNTTAVPTSTSAPRTCGHGPSRRLAALPNTRAYVRRCLSGPRIKQALRNALKPPLKEALKAKIEPPLKVKVKTAIKAM